MSATKTYTILQVAEALNLKSKESAYKLVRTGHLESFVPKGMTRPRLVTQEALDKYIKRSQKAS